VQRSCSEDRESSTSGLTLQRQCTPGWMCTHNETRDGEERMRSQKAREERGKRQRERARERVCVCVCVRVCVSVCVDKARQEAHSSHRASAPFLRHWPVMSKTKTGIFLCPATVWLDVRGKNAHQAQTRRTSQRKSTL